MDLEVRMGSPINGTEERLDAILEELKRQNELLQKLVPATPEPRLREPKRRRPT